jgi:hypothetical protein
MSRSQELLTSIRKRLISVENGAEQRFVDGQPVKDLATCGTCGLSWNDALMTERTPTPSARCPYEYEHEDIAKLKRINRRAYLQLVQETKEGQQ